MDERRKDCKECHSHLVLVERVAELKNDYETVKDKVSWKPLIWIMGSLVSVLIVIFGYQNMKIDTVVEAVHAMDKSVIALGYEVKELKHTQERNQRENVEFRKDIRRELIERIERHHSDEYKNKKPVK